MLRNKVCFLFKLYLVFIVLLFLVFIQVISSFQVINDDQDENKFDEIRQISNIPSYSVLSSSLPNNGKQGNSPDCLTKQLLSSVLTRDRRASISRPYFNHLRGSRDNSRYISKNLLAFSPRLGKRSVEDDNELNNHLNQQQNDEELDLFLSHLVNHIQNKRNDIVYEDSTKICFSESINDGTMKEALEKYDAHRRLQEEQERQSKNKHPLLFRYRLG